MLAPVSFLLILTVLNVGNAKDVVLNFMKKNVDQAMSPCENLHRHVCPINSNNMTAELIQDEENYLKSLGDIPFRSNNLTVLADLNKIEVDKVVLDVKILVNELCKYPDRDSRKIFIEKLMAVFKLRNILSPFYDDKNCDRAKQHLLDYMTKNPLANFSEPPIRTTFVEIDKLVVFYTLFKSSPFLEITRFGNEILEQMKHLLKEWMKKTPWLRNSNSTEVYENFVENVRYESIDEDIFPVLEAVVRLNSDYLICLRELNLDTEYSKSLCFFEAYHHVSDVLGNEHIKYVSGSHDGRIFNARIAYPTITFGTLMSLLADTEEFAIKMGTYGYVLGHELSHSVIEKYGIDMNLPYFSNDTRTCILNQFNSSCTEFKENGCETNPNQIDEAGSDILGAQLAYEITKDYYGRRFYDIYPPLNVTYQQTFFLASAMSACQSENGTSSADVHPTSNIRMNVLAQQIDEFAEAFNCPSESRMLRSKTETCIAFGEKAYALKRTTID